MTDMLLPVGGALLGSALAGSLISGAPIADVATSFDGALGAAAGIAIAPYLIEPLGIQDGNTAQLVILGSAFAVPALVSMSLDSTTLALGAGAAAGAWVATNYVAQYISASAAQPSK